MKTTKRTSTFIALLCLGFFICGPLSAQEKSYEPLLGVWDAQTEDGAFNFTFEFKLEDGKLVGIYTGSSGETEMENLTYENKRLLFSVSLTSMTIDFEAMIEGDALEGSLSMEYGEANISGTKRK